MVVHIAPTMRMVSSIAVASDAASRTTTGASSVQPSGSSTQTNTNAANGSLAVYLVLCAVVLLLVLGSAMLLWRIHGNRLPGLAPSSSAHDREEQRQSSTAYELERSNLQVPTLLYSPVPDNMNPKVGNKFRTAAFLKLPASLRIRSPVRANLKFFSMRLVEHEAADGTTANPVSLRSLFPRAHGASSNLAVPSIVISECSPVIPSAMTATSVAQTSSPLSSTSSGSSDSLRVPGSGPAGALPAAANSNPPLRKKSFASRRTAPAKAGKVKGVLRSPIRRGKENAPPAGFTGRVHDMSQDSATRRGTGPLGYRFP